MTMIETRPSGAAALCYVDRPRPESWRRNPWGFAPGGSTPGKGQAATVAEGSTASWADFARLAGADWTVSARDVFTVREAPDANGKRAIPCPDWRMLTRDDTQTPLKAVTSSYGVVQTSEVLALLSAVPGFSPDSLAVLDGGRSFYAQSLLGDDQVRAGDTGIVRRFRTATWSHGDGAVRSGETSVGIVCANTLAKARRDLDLMIRHTSGAARRVAQAARRLEAEESERREWLDHARRLAEVKARDVLGPLVPSDTSGAARLLAAAVSGTDVTPTSYSDLHARSQGVVTDVLALMRRADPRTGVAGDGSLYDLFQAVTFYASHERTVRGLDGAAAEVARYVDEQPAWVSSAWDAMVGVAADAAPVSVMVRS